MHPKNWFLILLFAVLTGCNRNQQETTQDKTLVMADSTNQPESTTLGPPLGGINPKHGEPGHRCDIAVGAKLPVKAPAVATTPPPPVLLQDLPARPKEEKTNSSIPTGVNPPHGQPHHRCDIAVGAPLNGKPMRNVSATVPVSKTGTPSNVQTNEKGQRLNPAHGQPYHRCDIAVGAPLT